jgi:hypothetical protein
MVYNRIMDTGHSPKNKVKPHIVKNFFTSEEVDVLLSIINYQKIAKDLGEFYSPLVLPNMARMQIEVMYLPSIQRKLEIFASEIVGEEVFMSHNSYLSYNKEHSPEVNPRLPVHYDSDNYFSKLTMDYQLNSNVDWPIVIEDEYFSLEYGDLLVFWGAGQAHWRDPVLFKEGDNTEVLTMHFSTKKDFQELNQSARAQEKRDQRLAIWRSDPVFVKYNEDFFAKEELINKTKNDNNS